MEIFIHFWNLTIPGCVGLQGFENISLTPFELYIPLFSCGSMCMYINFRGTIVCW